MEAKNEISKYKPLFISTLVINAIILFFLFNAYDGSQNYSGIKLYFSFVFGTWIGMGLIGCVAGFEFLKFIMNKKWRSVTQYVLTFSWLFNFYVFIIWITSIMMDMQAPKKEWWNAFICLIGAMMILLYQRNKRINNTSNTQ